MFNTQADFCQSLQNNVACDIAVIGDCISRIHTALYLAEKGRKVILLERNIYGESSTGKSFNVFDFSNEGFINKFS